MNLAGLLDVLGYAQGEFLSINYQPARTDEFLTRVVEYDTNVQAAALALREGNELWFGVCPVGGPARRNAGRGTAADVTRLAAVWIDLDLKPGGCRTPEIARAIVDDLSSIAGTQPSATVGSGHGLHAYWPIDDGHIGADFTTRQARALLRRWGYLVRAVAKAHNAQADSVFDLARVLRVPCTLNYKEYEPAPVVGQLAAGGPLTVGELSDRLDEAGMPNAAMDDDAAEVSPPTEWRYADEPCGYAITMIRGWASDNPSARNPWLYRQSIRLASAHRYGCLTAELHREGEDALSAALARLCARPGDTRPVKRHEVGGALARGQLKAASKTSEQLRDELGGADHGVDPLTGKPSGHCVSGRSEVSGTLDTPSSERESDRASSGHCPEVVRNVSVSVGPADLGSTGVPDTSTVPDTDMSGIDPLAGVVDGAWLDAQVFPPVEYVVPRLISEGIGIIAGPPKAGKSWLVAALALAVAHGGLFLGRIRVDQRPVLYLALEDGHRRLQSRFRAILGPGQPIPRATHVAIKATPDEARAKIAAFVARHADMKPLVILDTLGKVKPPKKASEDSYQADYRALSELKDIVDAAPGSSLVVVHHTRKAGSEDFVDATSGTYGITGAADFVAVLARKRKSVEATLSITGREIPEDDYALLAENRDGIIWRLDGNDLDDAAARVAERHALHDEVPIGAFTTQVLDLVNAAPAGVDAKAIAAQLPGAENDEAKVGRYLRRLHEGGRIDRTSRGKYRRIDPPCEVCGHAMAVGQVGTHLSCRTADDV